MENNICGEPVGSVLKIDATKFFYEDGGKGEMTRDARILMGSRHLQYRLYVSHASDFYSCFVDLNTLAAWPGELSDDFLEGLLAFRKMHRFAMLIANRP